MSGDILNQVLDILVQKSFQKLGSVVQCWSSVSALQTIMWTRVTWASY